MTLLADFGSRSPLRAFFYCSQQLVESFFEEPNAIGSELVGDFVDRDSQISEIAHHLLRAIEVFGQSLARLAMIPECVERRRRNRIDRVRPDHLLHVENVWIRGVFRAGASPQHPLSLCTPRFQFLPAR